MGTFAEISRYLVQTAFGVLLFAVLVRLLLQLARADFYNPISQFIVKVTSPLLRPLRRIIPLVGGIDLPLGRLDSASLVLALAIQCIATLVVLALLGFSIGNPLLLLAWSLLGILSLLLNIYFFGILLLIVFSWIAPQSHHPGIALLYQLTEPVKAAVRRLLPPLGSCLSLAATSSCNWRRASGCRAAWCWASDGGNRAVLALAGRGAVVALPGAAAGLGRPDHRRARRKVAHPHQRRAQRGCGQRKAVPLPRQRVRRRARRGGNRRRARLPLQDRAGPRACAHPAGPGHLAGPRLNRKASSCKIARPPTDPGPWNREQRPAVSAS